MKEFYEFENKVVKIIVKTLEHYSIELKKHGITYDYPEVEIWNNSSDKYESEYRIPIYKDNELVDILESHIIRNGKAIASLDEFKAWIQEDINDIIRDSKM